MHLYDLTMCPLPFQVHAQTFNWVDFCMVCTNECARGKHTDDEEEEGEENVEEEEGEENV